MRDIVRHMADFGEKMIQEDRNVDYKEDFEESDDSNYLALSSENDEDEDEWKRMKNNALQKMESKSKKQMLLAVVKT